jgi:hypothetical protein
MKNKSRAVNRSLAAAAVTAGLLFAAPFAATAQTSAAPGDTDMSSVRSLTSQVFDDVHNGNVADFAAITTPDFAVINPDGSTMPAEDLFARSMVRYLDEGGSDRSVRVESMTTDGTNITEDVSVDEYSTPVLSGDVTDTSQAASYSSRTLTWTPAPDGSWLLASEKINSVDRVDD